LTVVDAKPGKPIYQQLGLTDDEYQEIIKVLDGREPNDVELAMFSVMWSEHCSYKSSRMYLKNFPTKGDHVLVGPGEGAGVIDIGDDMALAIRIESHNHPSAIEPYQGAATGAGGILRDIFSMGARPIAILDSLRFGNLDDARTRYIAEGVVHGISGYGNAVGVPTVGGETVFDKCYRGNPLVNVMALGVLPKSRLMLARASSNENESGAGNLAVLLGASTGRDGIGGASVLASASFEDDVEVARPTVQVGDPFTEKKLIEATLELLDKKLAVGVQDLGAAGICCATSESAAASNMGIDIDLSAIHLREKGMTTPEIMTSESQERMLIICTPENLDEVLALAAKWEIDASLIGKITDTKRFIIRDQGFDGNIIADVPVGALGDGPLYKRPNEVDPDLARRQEVDVDSVLENKYEGADFNDLAKQLLAQPNIASKNWIFSQYDHQLFLQTVEKPGGDASLLRIHGAKAGVALSVDGKGRWAALDPCNGAIAIILEGLSNIACVGATAKAMVNNLNFGSPEEAQVMNSFDEVINGASQACLACAMPVVGGNVSFYNQSNGVNIDPTPVFGVIGTVENLRYRAPGIKFHDGDVIVLVETAQYANENWQDRDDVVLAGAEIATMNEVREGMCPVVDLQASVKTIEAVRDFIFSQMQKPVEDRSLSAIHDISKGGLFVTLCEMAANSHVGFEVAIDADTSILWSLFAEGPGRFIMAVKQDQLNDVVSKLDKVSIRVIGRVGGDQLIVHELLSTSLEKAIGLYK
jgi:phosphoribosylformylglycinamidine synthase II